MKRVYVEGYDTYVRFPDEVSNEEMQKALATHYPETDDQFVARIKDPTTQAADVSFKDFQRYKELDTGIEMLEVPGLITQAASIAARELYDGAKAAVNLGLQGEGGKAAASLAEGAARGTTDLYTLGNRIAEGFYQHLEPYIKESGDVEIDQYHRFLALKSLDNIRESARSGNEVLLEDFGLTPEMVDNDLAEGSSYFLDPSMVVGFGSGKATSMMARAASKPVRMAGTGLTRTAQGIRSVADRLSGVRTRATDFLDETTGGYGRAAAGGLAVGGAAVGLGLGPAAAAGGTAIFGLPAMELAGAGLSAFGDAMRLSPTRMGGLELLARNAPDTLAGKAAGKLQFLDKPIEYLGRTAGGAAVGAGVGAGLGGLAGGLEGAAQGFGAGFTSGAVGSVAGRFVEGATGLALRRAEENDYRNWRSQVDEPLGEYFDKYFKDHSSRTKGMDLVQLVQTAAAEKNYNVQVLEPKDYDARFNNASEGVAMPEGDAPIVYLRGVFDGKRGKDSALRLLAHEAFHAIARLDGFDVLARRIGEEAAAMYNQDEIGQFVRTYEGKLDPTKKPTITESSRNKIIEELGAEYFANLITGKDSSYILRGDGFTGAVKAALTKLIPGKLSRVIDAFESPIFGPMRQANPALRRAIGDLVKARRKAYSNVMLGNTTPTKVYNETDLGNDKIYAELESIGAAYTDKKGRRQMHRPSGEKRIQKERAQAVAAALDKVPASTVDAEGGGLVRQSDGSYVGKKVSPSQLEAILNDPGMPDKVKEGFQFISQASGIINATYAAATAKVQRRGKKNVGKFVTRYRNLPYTNRDVAVYEIVVSPKAGTFRAELLDMSFLQAKAALNWNTNKAWQDAFGSVDGMVADVKTYINALGGDVPTAKVLGSEQKRNLLNKFLGIRNVKGNPLIAEDYKVKEGEHPWRSFRLDRIISLKPRVEEVPTTFSQRAYQMGQQNFSPYDADYGKPNRISTRTPTALQGAFGDPISEQLTVGLEPFQRDATLANKAATKIKASRILTPRQSGKSDLSVIDSYMQHGVDNLLWLHDNAPEAVRTRGKLWYDGARKIVDEWSEKYGHSPQKIAAVIAALSPQRDWFQNVDHAKRIIEFNRDKRNSRWTFKMNEAAESIGSASATAKKAIADIRNKPFSKMENDFERAVWFRVWDRTNNSKTYPIISPEGTFEGVSKSQDGNPESITWGTYPVIGRAFRILNDIGDTRAEIADNLTSPNSLSHKVRNFYNNIINPAGDFGDVTVDTHAVAAIYMKPLSGASPEVNDNLGSFKSKPYGISGTYGINAEIYRRAAQRRNLLTREMQSITWEAIRSLYSPEFKRNKKDVAKINTVWERFRRRSITLDEARTAITEIAGGFTRPDWDGRSSNNEKARSTNDQGSVSRPDLYGRSSRGGRSGDPQRDPSQLDLRFSPAADLDRLGFYSKAERTIRNLPQSRGTAQQFKAALEKAGVKAEEIAETGLDQFFQDNPKTNKEDILLHLEAAKLDVVELQRAWQTMTFAESNAYDDLLNTHISKGGLSEKVAQKLARDFVRRHPGETLERISKRLKRFKERMPLKFGDERATLKRSINFHEMVVESILGSSYVGPTKFFEFTMPNAKESSYRERLLTKRNYAGELDFVYPSHFAEANILAHVRHTDRTGPNGERVLFIEELQSDWHQQGREKGYKGQEPEPEWTHAQNKEYNQLKDEMRQNYDAAKAFNGILTSQKELRNLKAMSNVNFVLIKQMENYLQKSQANYDQAINDGQSWTDMQDARLEVLQIARNRHDGWLARQRSAVPDAPFKKTWPEMSMKRMLRVAAEEGYDAIAWTTGTTQNKRYSLSQQVEEIAYNPKHGHFIARRKDAAGPDVRKTVDNEGLTELIGKELANRLLTSKPDEATGVHVLKGVDLEIGGEGMKGFYDNMLPKLKAWKQVKGADGKRLKVDMKTIGDDMKVHYVALDETAKDSILDQGLPMFSPRTTQLTKQKSLNNRGGAIHTNGRGDKAIQTSSRSGVRVYSDRGKRIGPVFTSVEKAQDYLNRN